LVSKAYNNIHKFYRIAHSLLFILLLGYDTTPVIGAFEDLPVGGKAIGLGSAYVAVAQGPESLFFNPAGLSQTKCFSFSFFISRPYGLKELTYETLSISLPTRYGCFGLALRTFGHDLYRENFIAVGWGNGYREKAHYGLLVRLNQLQIDKYGSDTALTLEAGILLKLPSRITWGIAATNVSRSRMGERRELLPQTIRLGLSVLPIPDLLLSLEADKDTRFPVELRGGCEFRPLPNLSLRCGFIREPSNFSAGIGLAWNIFSLDYGFTSHPVLGTTHQGSLSFYLNPVHRM